MTVGFIYSISSLPDIESDVHDSNRVKFFGLDADNKILIQNKIKEHFGKSLMMWPTKESGIGDTNNAIVVDGVTLPNSVWPASIRQEDDNFEDIIHPGDEKTVISVPKFWSTPLLKGELMSPELATRIGSYVNGKTDVDPNNKGSPDERTIFIAIASYRDWQCRYTIESIFNNAKFPHRVRVGIADQIGNGDASCGAPINPCKSNPNQALCKYKNQIDVIEIDAVLAIGPVFARHLGHRMYRGEYYALQVDAHVTFVKYWDTDIISQHMTANNDMATLTTYLSDIEGALDGEGKSKTITRPIMCNTDYEDDGQGSHLRHGAQPEDVATIKGTPQLEPYWAAGFSFSRGHFVVNVPYDLYTPMIFQGEEMSIGIRGFTYGYDHYAPERSICFHSYAIGDHAASRNKVSNFAEHASLYKGTGIAAMKRILGVIGMNPEVDPSEWKHDEEARYGIGNVRKASRFFEIFGIDIVKKKTQKNLCKFVESGMMHKMFLQYLRDDGMGIDYSKIDYKFKSSDFNKGEQDDETETETETDDGTSTDED